MTSSRLALTLLALLLAAPNVPAADEAWSSRNAPEIATTSWLLAVQVHPRNAIADLAEPPDEALDAVAAVTGHAVEFVGRSDPQGSFRLRLVEADDFDTVSDAANAVRMLDDVLWVSVIAEHRADTPSSVAPSGAGAPQAAGEPVSRILVMFRDPATRNARSRQDALPELLVEAMRRQAGSDLELVRPMSGGAWVFELPEALDPTVAEKVIAQLRQMPQVESAEASQRVHAQLQPNDPYFPITGSLGQYNLVAPGTPGPWGGPVFGIDAVNAWNITTGSANTRVAVLDTGVLFNHPDIAGRFLPGHDFVDNDTNASDPGDHCPPTGSASTWHGTHISGTIAANTNDGVGAAGVDWATRIVPVRALGQCGGLAEDVIDGMRWAAGLPVPGAPANAYPVRVINLSLAGIGTCTASWQQAIDDVIAAGALVVVSAGNQGTAIDWFSPASCNGVITVVASDPNGDKASYSNYGGDRLPELAAPGGDLSRFGDLRAGIIAASNAGTTSPGSNTWAAMSGTSMAVPHVVGTASLMLAINPALSPSQLFSMITTAENLTAFAQDSDFTLNYPLGGRGILNAYKAVQAAQATVQPPAPSTAPMLLRDAVYLYDQPLSANGDKVLTGVDCDVFQLVLDVKSGYTDLAMAQSTTLAEGIATATPYRNRIRDTAAMFAYSLYESTPVKSFTFRDADAPDSEATIGTATVFGYCFSRTPGARVYLHDKTSCENTYSDRTTSCSVADNGSGAVAPTSMRLRDAIYLYGQDVRANSDLQLGGSNCDVLQLVLDVESGHTDLTMVQGANVLEYPNRIFDTADMFAYALYSSAPHKRFDLGDRDGAAQDILVGEATAFAYCYSTQPGAFVYRKNTTSQNCTNSDGQPIVCP